MKKSPNGNLIDGSAPLGLRKAVPTDGGGGDNGEDQQGSISVKY
jgi:hypothetical protein